ncbi:unnamed protein product [Periconia digitata]|uniref:Uncharacterized protein n=1 Tax=Periconia digitata TaxID=1303443 RepID=A0A9W4UL65_9PLEO|nr:unnamed protein product [Periconia digitata]
MCCRFAAICKHSYALESTSFVVLFEWEGRLTNPLVNQETVSSYEPRIEPATRTRNDVPRTYRVVALAAASALAPLCVRDLSVLSRGYHLRGLDRSHSTILVHCV